MNKTEKTHKLDISPHIVFLGMCLIGAAFVWQFLSPQVCSYSFEMAGSPSLQAAGNMPFEVITYHNQSLFTNGSLNQVTARIGNARIKMSGQIFCRDFMNTFIGIGQGLDHMDSRAVPVTYNLTPSFVFPNITRNESN